jgi:hypothetical protein
MPIKIISLKGSHQEMGNQYGKLMHDELHGALATLKDYFITENNMTYENMVEQANVFYQRYSHSYELFLRGIAEGSNLTLDDINVLNGMETINVETDQKNNFLNIKRPVDVSACAFVYLPPERTYSGSGLIGRNYDFGEPYNKIAQNLTVTILNEDNMVSTAIISMPGQIYCPSCVNSKGIFMELNNGMPSGGYYDALDRQSLLINMLYINQNSDNLQAIEKQLKATESDYSLIINTADKSSAKSFEFSTTLGMRPNFPIGKEAFISTNYFQNSSWGNLIPNPTDETTWMGVTRHNNLQNLAAAQDIFNISSFQNLMNVNIENGGAFWDETIYQIIFDTSNNDLYLKRALFDQDSWTQISLIEYFNN